MYFISSCILLPMILIKCWILEIHFLLASWFFASHFPRDATFMAKCREKIQILTVKMTCYTNNIILYIFVSPQIKNSTKRQGTQIEIKVIFKKSATIHTTAQRYNFNIEWTGHLLRLIISSSKHICPAIIFINTKKYREISVVYPKTLVFLLMLVEERNTTVNSKLLDKQEGKHFFPNQYRYIGI